jgi:pyruvate kinase
MTDVLATLGPASASVETLAEMIRSGMTVARMNFSHGDYAFHTRMADMVREAARVAGKPVSLLADLQGAKVRIGKLAVDIPLQTGMAITLTGPQIDWAQLPDEVTAGRTLIPVDFDLAPYVKPHATILVDDGNVELQVEESRHGVTLVQVVHGAVIKSRKGVNVPYTLLPIPALTDKDRADVAFVVGLGVDWIALSFAGSAADVEELRELIEAAPHRAAGPSPKVMAKIERPDGVENLRPIIHASDAVMVARGDLALETSPWQLPLLQKQIVRACRDEGKPVVVATQMLESMIHNHRPTRAEVSDVANALLDGADGVMLSAETAVGSYPVQAVRTMLNICQNVMPSQSDAHVLLNGLGATPRWVLPNEPAPVRRERFVF